jgi:hypothetical protein
MTVLSRVRGALARWSAWRQANPLKPLRQMPTGYLMLMAASSAFVVLMLTSWLPQATVTFVEHVVPTAPAPVSVIVGLVLLACWGMLGVSALWATTHGRALGEKLFDPQRN